MPAGANKLCISIVLVLVGILFLSSCYQHTYVPARTRDFTIQSSKDRSHAIPYYVLYNLNDSVSRLYYAVKTSDLLFERSNVNNEMQANIKVEYIVHPTGATKTITDSGYVILNNIRQDGAEWQYGYLDFDIPTADENYFMDVTLRDLNKMSTTYDLLYLFHKSADASSNFVLMQPNSQTPIYRTTLSKDEEFNLRYKDPSITKIYVRYYKNSSSPARPPYSMPVPSTEVLPDSSYTIDISSNPVMKLPTEGYYRYSTQPDSKEGFTVCRFKDDYPKVTTPLALLEPLRYITTKNEYAKLESSTHLKSSIDSFWIATGGSHERARELIAAYYGRVEIVNTHFSTYKEGWKTDRGMVYIIYGEPQNVYRYPDRETWVYGSDNSGNTLNFVFDRVTTSGYTNDFELQRNQVYNVSWITAVDYWKQGQVYRAR